MDIMTAIATASKSLEVVKAIRDIDRKFGEAELKAKSAELLSDIADLKIVLVETRELLNERDEEIARPKAAFAFRGELVEVRGYKYEKRPDGGPQGTAFCPRCETKDGRYFRMTYSRGLIEQQCPECKTKYTHLSGYLYPDE